MIEYSLLQKIATQLFLLLFAIQSYAISTDVRLYNPFDEAPVQATPIINNTYQGVCHFNSRISKRSNALNCFANQHYFDPCFVRTFTKQKEIICPQSPWSSKVTRIIVDKPIQIVTNEQLDMSKEMPWSIELTSGHYCTQITKSIKLIDNKKVHYQCDNNTFLIGYLQRCKGLWRTLSKKGQNHLHMSYIQRAWF